jgi:hypothetical protein
MLWCVSGEFTKCTFVRMITSHLAAQRTLMDDFGQCWFRVSIDSYPLRVPAFHFLIRVKPPARLTNKAGVVTVRCEYF